MLECVRVGRERERHYRGERKKALTEQKAGSNSNNNNNGQQTKNIVFFFLAATLKSAHAALTLLTSKYIYAQRERADTQEPRLPRFDSTIRRHQASRCARVRS